MMTNNELFYEIPLVEVIEVDVEKGFASSDGNMENFQEGNESNW